MLSRPPLSWAARFLAATLLSFPLPAHAADLPEGFVRLADIVRQDMRLGQSAKRTAALAPIYEISRGTGVAAVAFITIRPAKKRMLAEVEGMKFHQQPNAG